MTRDELRQYYLADYRDGRRYVLNHPKGFLKRPLRQTEHPMLVVGGGNGFTKEEACAARDRLGGQVLRLYSPDDLPTALTAAADRCVFLTPEDRAEWGQTAEVDPADILLFAVPLDHLLGEPE